MTQIVGLDPWYGENKNKEYKWQPVWKAIVTCSNDIINSEIYPVSNEIEHFSQFFHETLNYSNRTE